MSAILKTAFLQLNLKQGSHMPQEFEFEVTLMEIIMLTSHMAKTK